MAALKPITIVGGGLAGLTLGIGLRQRGIPVTIWEAASYPRHRVCGEFISGRGQAVLERLGLLADCLQAGAVYARTAMFVCGAGRGPVRLLPEPALCLSRHALDALLAASFQAAGGELRRNRPWNSPGGAEGVVRASGRRTQPSENAPRWFGLKAHVASARAPALEADLEMHLSRDGYVGMNRIDHGEINVCGLFRVRAGGRRPEARQDWLRGETGSVLHERLQAAEFDPDSFCSVAGLTLAPQRAAGRDECCVGDRLTMTPPITGNGMSMAFESAELAIEALAEYSQGRLNWALARSRIAQRCDAAFAGRLAWARRLQGMMISPALHTPLGLQLLRWDWLWRFMFAKTRR
jgi:2-polyprenyl-6-methoxyphenol hydroxylase-like FAD-dependent oxidoreductase